jgi:hypothetical protein
MGEQPGGAKGSRCRTGGENSYIVAVAIMASTLDPLVVPPGPLGLRDLVLRTLTSQPPQFILVPDRPAGLQFVFVLVEVVDVIGHVREVMHVFEECHNQWRDRAAAAERPEGFDGRDRFP